MDTARIHLVFLVLFSLGEVKGLSFSRQGYGSHKEDTDQKLLYNFTELSHVTSTHNKALLMKTSCQREESQISNDTTDSLPVQPEGQLPQVRDYDSKHANKESPEISYQDQLLEVSAHKDKNIVRRDTRRNLEAGNEMRQTLNWTTPDIMHHERQHRSHNRLPDIQKIEIQSHYRRELKNPPFNQARLKGEDVWLRNTVDSQQQLRGNILRGQDVALLQPHQGQDVTLLQPHQRQDVTLLQPHQGQDVTLLQPHQGQDVTLLQPHQGQDVTLLQPHHGQDVALLQPHQGQNAILLQPHKGQDVNLQQFRKKQDISLLQPRQGQDVSLQHQSHQEQDINSYQPYQRQDASLLQSHQGRDISLLQPYQTQDVSFLQKNNEQYVSFQQPLQGQNISILQPRRRQHASLQQTLHDERYQLQDSMQQPQKREDVTFLHPLQGQDVNLIHSHQRMGTNLPGKLQEPQHQEGRVHAEGNGKATTQHRGKSTVEEGSANMDVTDIHSEHGGGTGQHLKGNGTPRYTEYYPSVTAALADKDGENTDDSHAENLPTNELVLQGRSDLQPEEYRSQVGLGTAISGECDSPLQETSSSAMSKNYTSLSDKPNEKSNSLTQHSMKFIPRRSQSNEGLVSQTNRKIFEDSDIYQLNSGEVTTEGNTEAISTNGFNQNQTGNNTEGQDSVKYSDDLSRGYQNVKNIGSLDNGKSAARYITDESYNIVNSVPNILQVDDNRKYIYSEKMKDIPSFIPITEQYSNYGSKSENSSGTKLKLNEDVDNNESVKFSNVNSSVAPENYDITALVTKAAQQTGSDGTVSNNINDSEASNSYGVNDSFVSQETGSVRPKFQDAELSDSHKLGITNKNSPDFSGNVRKQTSAYTGKTYFSNISFGDSTKAFHVNDSQVNINISLETNKSVELEIQGADDYDAVEIIDSMVLHQDNEAMDTDFTSYNDDVQQVRDEVVFNGQGISGSSAYANTKGNGSDPEVSHSKQWNGRIAYNSRENYIKMQESKKFNDTDEIVSPATRLGSPKFTGNDADDIGEVGDDFTISKNSNSIVDKKSVDSVVNDGMKTSEVVKKVNQDRQRKSPMHELLASDEGKDGDPLFPEDKDGESLISEDKDGESLMSEDKDGESFISEGIVSRHGKSKELEQIVFSSDEPDVSTDDDSEASVDNDSEDFSDDESKVPGGGETSGNDDLSEVLEEESELSSDEHKLSGDEYKFLSVESKLPSDKSKLSNEESKLSSEEPKLSNDESKLSNYESRLSSEESKLSIEDHELSSESKFSKSESKLSSNESKLSNNEFKLSNNESRFTNNEF
ncbi:dentin sialophosphoprotein isoform X2 [Cherax quadricarinatus]|uniref:dentin sialophosphoprotein isoform X2 n=1 Tax=Cherax quadricarinatus TaxID=27406 RepID=UPI00387E78AF